jgi:hypothetical protein
MLDLAVYKASAIQSEIYEPLLGNIHFLLTFTYITVNFVITFIFAEQSCGMYFVMFQNIRRKRKALNRSDSRFRRQTRRQKPSRSLTNDSAAVAQVFF